MAELKDVSLELWVDSPKHDVLNHGFIRTLHDLGVKTLSIMIDPSTKEWDPQWKAADIEALLKLLDPFEMDAVLTTWPFPDKAQLDSMAQDMMQLLHIGCGIVGWEVDVEFNWKQKYVNGFQATACTPLCRR
jgi:hypothetical protein